VDSTDLLLKLIEQLREDMARDQEQARESRAKLYDRVDAIVDQLAAMDKTAALSGEIDAQVRRELDIINQRLDPKKGDVGTTVAAWGDLLTTGRRLSLLAGIVGITGIGSFIAALTGAWDWIRNVLKLH